MTGQELLTKLWGGSLELAPGDVYLLAAVVPQVGVKEITSSALVVDAEHLDGEGAQRLAQALRITGLYSEELVTNEELLRAQ